MRRGTVFALFLLALVLGSSLVYVPKWQVGNMVIEDQMERLKLENELRGSLAQIYGIAFVLVGLGGSRAEGARRRGKGRS